MNPASAKSSPKSACLHCHNNSRNGIRTKTTAAFFGRELPQQKITGAERVLPR
jgi:hypothetical protein